MGQNDVVNSKNQNPIVIAIITSPEWKEIERKKKHEWTWEEEKQTHSQTAVNQR